MRSEDQRRNESQPRIITSYQHAQAPHSVRIVPALLPPRSSYPENRVGEGADDASDEDNDSFPSDWDDLDRSKEELLAKSLSFDIAYDADRGFRGTELKFCSFSRPHMRAFHASWVCFFTSFFVQFSAAPLLHDIQKSLKLSKADVWWSNLWFQIGGIPARFLLWPLCDKYGARATMTVLLGLAAIPSALTGLLSTNLMTLTVMRTAVGAMDTFVPCQYWIVSFFVREVGGTAMAIAGGLGASGSGVTQLVTGSVVYPALLRLLNNDEDLAWRWALVVPSIFAIGIAGWFYHFSDDCPLGNFEQVKKAGLMVERSAVDSFRSGVYNLNSWILFIQYAGSCGVDFTMSNGTAIYYQAQFRQSTAVSGAIAFLYGLSAVFARGAGGWLSDKASDKFALQGRLWAQLLCMTLQGVTNIWLARTKVFADTLPILVIFSIFVQMSMGCCYGIVPYVDGPNTGSVAGVVGAGGSIGAALLALMFMNQDYDASMEWMGWFTIFTAIFTPLIIVKGYRGLVFGSDDSDDAATRQQHSPLLVPGKLHRSPHLVSLHARRQQLRR